MLIFDSLSDFVIKFNSSFLLVKCSIFAGELPGGPRGSSPRAARAETAAAAGSAAAAKAAMLAAEPRWGRLTTRLEVSLTWGWDFLEAAFQLVS